MACNVYVLHYTVVDPGSDLVTVLNNKPGNGPLNVLNNKPGNDPDNKLDSKMTQ